MTRGPADVHFRETQRFRQPWLWGLLIGVAVLVGGSLYAEGASGPGTAIGLAVVVALLALFAVAKLTVEVRGDGVRIQFFPFHLSPRRIPLEAIERSEAVEYSPIRDYGGWGIRWTGGGKAYNVSGSEGVRVDRRDAKQLLIGSQRADELEAAIERARK
ncbi:hypothetical protein [Natronoarchaeum rubrum]|uniref:hypothetical protein n=1 Tax=Natronoarchaeum rubrum TaxID=755311 RepID=UPI0021114DB1|nr:hypothetical protein [Natronoarchaeum rubrum]HMB49021.1 hypothetical protein [Natronoarchaeum rubrum]